MIIDRTDLNDLDNLNDSAYFGPREGIFDNAPSVEVCMTQVEDRVVRFIRASNTIVGCMAWLTNMRILDTLARKNVSIIVQKEDFLRPDGCPSSHKRNLRAMYDKLGYWYDRHEVPAISHLSYCSEGSIQSVRCAGVHWERGAIYPKMHHKFIVDCDVIQPSDFGIDYMSDFKPKRVLTGSFNFSSNGTRSLENIVIINDHRVAEVYYDEWARVMAISEPLNWNSEWVEPEWRDGS